MKMEINLDDEKILEYFKDKEYIITQNTDINIVRYLANRFDDAQTLKEAFYRIKYKIFERPTCTCGKPLQFVGNDATVFRKSCGDSKCQYESKKKTLYKNFGVINVFQLDSVKQKIEQTSLEKYGVKSPKQSKIVNDKYKETCMKRYGADNAFKNKDIQEKYKETCLERYGVDHNWKIQEEQIKSHSKEALDKCFRTQKKNGTVNKSKLEDKSFDLLKEKFNDVVRNYKCERYPFACDFYIPSLDIFIECQYSMFHHGRPYIGDENDLKEVELIKEKSEKRKQENGRKNTRYDALIETWTVRDVKKRNIAKENNLNYFEFFTILELEKWLKEYNGK